MGERGERKKERERGKTHKKLMFARLILLPLLSPKSSFAISSTARNNIEFQHPWYFFMPCKYLYIFITQIIKYSKKLWWSM